MMRIKFAGSDGFYGGLSIKLQQYVGDMHLRAYTELGFSDLEINPVIELNNIYE